MKLFFLGLFFSTLLIADPSTSHLPTGCEFDKECLQELPGAFCGDGTNSYMTVTIRPKAKNLLIYLEGGGACWDYKSCTGGFAKSLTRVEPQNDWNAGTGIQDNKSLENPFRDYTVVTVPYCTGDVFGGARDAEYKSSSKETKKVKHVGYQNVLLALKKVQELYPSPEKVSMVGTSAGGMGVFFHMKNLVKTYPNATLSVISDAGMPFKPPYIKEAAYKGVMKNWGAMVEKESDTLADLVGANTKLFPQVRFGLIGAYSDYVMSFFAFSLGTSSTFSSVKKTLIDAADNYIGMDKKNQKVFYIDSTQHGYLKKELKGVESAGVMLADWTMALVNNQETNWKNVRPDLTSELTSQRELELKALDWGAF